MTFVTSQTSHDFTGNLTDAGVRVIEVPSAVTWRDRTFSLPIKRFLRTGQLDSDIFHYHGVWKATCHRIASYARINGIPYVINPRGDLELFRVNRGKIRKFKKDLAWLLYVKKDVRNAACVLTTSRQEADAVMSRGVNCPVAIIPNGIDIGVFPDEVHHPVKENGKKTVLFLSRINPIKGIDLLIEAWSRIPESDREKWELHIVGNSDPAGYEDTLKEMVSAKGLNSSVKFPGPLRGQAKIDKYCSSDLFILPTHNENFGNVIAEAMMCECPVITTTNAPWSGIRDEKLGWWVDLSVENIMSSLREGMALSDAGRLALGKKGRQYIIDNFSSQEVAKKTYSLYKWILGEEGKPDFVIVPDSK